MKNLSLSAGILIAIAFFMPWITVSCGGVEVTTDGYSLATGDYAQENDLESSQEDAAYTYLFVVPLVGLAALGIGVLLHNKGISPLDAGALLLILALVGFAAQGYFYYEMHSDLEEAQQEVSSVIALSYEYGWWFSLLGLGLMLVSPFIRDKVPD